jgi:hypothetical protein
VRVVGGLDVHCQPDHLDALAVLEFLYEVGEIASGGDDIRERLFG